MFIDDQQPSSGSISVFLITKYTIDSVLSVYHIMILLHVTIYITISIYRSSTRIMAGPLYFWDMAIYRTILGYDDYTKTINESYVIPIYNLLKGTILKDNIRGLLYQYGHWTPNEYQSIQ